METAAVALMMIGPIVAMTVTLANAKKLNQRHRERRAARQAVHQS